MNVLLIVVGLLLFIGLVVVHEFGHFIMARRNGVVVEEFGIGMPPRVWSRRTKGGWLFSVNLLPIGGFVKLKGEHDSDTEPGSMGAASLSAKMQIMAAGVVMNLLTAYILLVMLALVGMPQLVDNQFTVRQDAHVVRQVDKYIAAGDVQAGSPGAQAGVRANDRLVAFGLPGQARTLTDDAVLPALTRQYAGQTVEIQYRHGKNQPLITKQTTLRSAAEVAASQAAGKPEGNLGITIGQAQNGVTVVRSTWSAPIVAAGVVGQYTALTLQGLGKAVQGVGGIVAGAVMHNTKAREAAQTQAASQVSGPVGVFFVFKYGSALGFGFILFIVAILSLTLAVMNILPIPALDGGRLWLILITRALKRPLSPSREEAINAAGFIFLMSLIALITIVDVRRFL